MAKHAHQLILLNKKTWRCKLEGCSFFVHLGLAHILENKIGVCNQCGEQFRIDAHSLKEDMPRCSECRTGITPEVAIDFEEHIKRMNARNMLKEIFEEDNEIEEIEAEETHAADCMAPYGGECSCK